VRQPLLAHHEVRPGGRRRRVYRVAEGSSECLVVTANLSSYTETAPRC
jgi:hypothetical protein